MQKKPVNFGISSEQILRIQNIFAAFPEVKRVWIFGSRALGTHKEMSDIDFAIEGKRVSFSTVSALKAQFQESPIPYFIDIVSLPHLDSPELRQHIAKHGKNFPLLAPTFS